MYYKAPSLLTNTTSRPLITRVYTKRPRLPQRLIRRPLSQSSRQNIAFIPTPLNSMASTGLFEDATPSIIKDSKGLHLLTMNTPNGQKVQILNEVRHEHPIR